MTDLRLFGLCVRAAVLSLVFLAAGVVSSSAQIGSARYGSIVIDVASGRVLSAANPDDLRHPASLTKMMTLYMVFEALRDRRVTLDELVPISAHAASVEPSKLGLMPGTRMTVEQGILGLVTKSANDAAAALGELLGGDEPRFAEMMTLRARALGMSNTTFRNASGLPDPYQYSTARDLALLARHLVQDFPVEYRYFSVPSFVFRSQTIFNHDHMLLTYPGADGLKTGYTEASGHNLVTSALHGPVRLVGVVLGAGSNAERDIQMASLLNAGFTAENAPDVGPDLTAQTRIAEARRPRIRLPGLIASAEAAPFTDAAKSFGRSPRQRSRGKAMTMVPAQASHDRHQLRLEASLKHVRGRPHTQAAKRNCATTLTWGCSASPAARAFASR